MTIRFDRPVSKAAHRARLFAAFSLILSVLALLDHRFGPLETPYLVLFLSFSALLALASVVMAFVGLTHLWNDGAVAGRAAMGAVIFAALPLALVGFAAFRYETLPKLYDVSSDTANPPAWLEAPPTEALWLSRDDVTPATREAQTTAYPGLTGRRYEGAMDRVLLAVRKVARQRGITFTKADGADVRDPTIDDLPMKRQHAGPIVEAPSIGPVPARRPDRSLDNDPIASLIAHNTDVTLQGEARSKLLGLRFDVIIRLHEEETTTLVDIRVASRYGAHDLGFSDALAESYLQALDVELLGIAGT